MPAHGRTWRTYSALLSDVAHWAGIHSLSGVKYQAEFNPHTDEDALFERFTQALAGGDPEAQAVLTAQNVSYAQFRFHLRYVARWGATRRRLLAEGGNFQLLEGLKPQEKDGQLEGLVLKGTRVTQERALADHLRAFLPVPKGEGWLAPIANPGKPVREYKQDEVVWIYPTGELQQADDLHPSVARSLIRRYLPEAGTVVDPMAGSGTIARMAALMGHRAWASDVQPREPYIALHDIYKDPLDELFGEQFRVAADLVFVHPPTPEELGMTGSAYLDWLTQVLVNCWGAVRQGGHVVLVVGVTEKAGVLARAERALVDSANEAFEDEGLATEGETLTAQHLAASRDGTQGWHILVLQRPNLESDAET